MTPDDVHQLWSSYFGLSSSPLFEKGEAEDAAAHCVLLDGGYGTFVLSVGVPDVWHTGDIASWTWSANIPHHVTVMSETISVLRWDNPEAVQQFRRSGVENNLSKFYEHLCNDRLRSNRTVVEHLLGYFRRIRSMGYASGIPDERSTDIFLTVMAQLIEPEEVANSPGNLGLPEDASSLLKSLHQANVSAVLEEMSRASSLISSFKLFPALAIRHASSQLFQEAHSELLRASTSSDLFNLVGEANVDQRPRQGAHYTPPALARLLVEQSISALENVATRQTLIICDPACGSGAFLFESLRVLRRIGFTGRLVISGQDISAAAVSMARFVLRMALRDWSPEGGYELHIRAGDSLGALGIPDADLIIMNPPFVSFGVQSREQKEQLREAFGGRMPARGDLCMAFLLRAIESLKEGGVLGALFPASLLSSKFSYSLRQRISESGPFLLLGSIGDFGLFTHAQVQVGCIVLRKDSAKRKKPTTALVTGNDARPTGEAFRWLRKRQAEPASIEGTGSDWSIFLVSGNELENRKTWRFPTPRDQSLLRSLENAGVQTIAELFDVRQGIQTGLNEAFLLTEEEWRGLPTNERKYFRRATMGDSIHDGLIVKTYFLFFPHLADGPMFEEEKSLQRAVPNYFKLFLQPYRDRLSSRATIRRSRRTDWWGLMHPREWSLKKEPRIISKFFGSVGSFVVDYSSEYLPVMGHAWFPKVALSQEDDSALPTEGILAAYVALLNSSTFVNLLEIFSPHVSGGQFDLSGRHVAEVPIPNLKLVSEDLERGKLVSTLVESGQRIDIDDRAWTMRNNNIVRALYGIDGEEHF